MSKAIVKKETQEVQATSPQQTINLAIEKGLDLDKVEKALELQMRWEANEAKKAYAISMAEAQKEMPIVIKKSLNQQTSSKYAKEDDISKTIKPIYTDKGFSLSFDIGYSPLEKHIRVLCYVLHSNGHKEERHIDYPYDSTGIKGTVNKTQIHAYKSTISYAKNTLTCMVFNVATGDDNDAQSATPQVKITDKELSWIRDEVISLEINQKKFCEYLNVEDLGELTEEGFKKAKIALSETRKRKGGK